MRSDRETGDVHNLKHKGGEGGKDTVPIREPRTH